MRSAYSAAFGALVVLTAGCTGFSDREAETKSIADAMRGTPGVVSVDYKYGNSVGMGAEFTLRARR
jgi:hypothetical protein